MRISDWSSDVCSSDLLELAVLHHALQAHRAIGHPAQRGDGRTADVEHGEVAAARKRGTVPVPPDVGSAAAVVDPHHLARAVAGLADARFVRMAAVDPPLDLAAPRLATPVGFVVTCT